MDCEKKPMEPKMAIDTVNLMIAETFIVNLLSIKKVKILTID